MGSVYILSAFDHHRCRAMVMMVEFLRRIRSRTVQEIFVGVSMVHISHKNCGLTVVVMVHMGRSRRMKTGAKHREKNQELENNAPHHAYLAEQ